MSEKRPHPATNIYVEHPSIYVGTASTATSVTQANSIRAVEGIMEKLPDSELFTLAFDGEPVGPRIGVENVPDTTLKAFAIYEYDRRQSAREDKKANVKLTVTVLVAAGGWLAALAVALLK